VFKRRHLTQGEWTKIEARLSIPEGIEDYQTENVCPSSSEPGSK